MAAIDFVPDQQQQPAEPIEFLADAPDMSKAKEYIEKNVKDHFDALKKEPEPAEGQGERPIQIPEVNHAKGFLQAIQAGYQSSVMGLVNREKKPDVAMPAEDADESDQILAQATQTVLDLPLNVEGLVMGGLATAHPLGAAAGAFALPEALRSILMDQYENGQVKDPQDFMNRTMAIAWEAIKGATTGVATEFAGGKVGGKLAEIGLRSSMTQAARMATELGIMTTVSKGMAGQLPHAKDFVNAAIVLGGLHGVTHIAPKLRQIYTKTGQKPEDVVQRAQVDSQYKAEVVGSNPDLPIETQPKEEPIKPPTPEPPKPPEEMTELDKARAKTDERVAKHEDKPKEAFSPRKFAESMYEKIVDYAFPIRAIMRELGIDGLPANKDIYKLIRLHAAYGDKVLDFVLYETRDFKTGLVNGEGFEPILNDMEKAGLNRQDLTRYAVQKRTLELDAKGIETGLKTKADFEAAKTIVKELGPQYEPYFRRIVDFRNRMRDYAVGAGLISQDAAERMDAEHADYVPFYRMQDEDEVTGKTPARGKRQQPFKKIFGSDKKILDPIFSTYLDIEVITRAAELNHVKTQLIDTLMGTDGGEEFVRKVQPQMRSFEIEADEMAREFKKQGLDPELATDMMVFRPDRMHLAESEDQIYREGKREVYEFDPGVKKVLDILNGNREAVGLYATLMRPFASVLRKGITTDPVFSLKHTWRQQLTAATFSETAQIPFLSSIKSIKDLAQMNEPARQALFDGALTTSLEKFDKSYIATRIFDLDDDVNPIKKTWNNLKEKSQILEAGLRFGDNLARLAEYTRKMEGKTPTVENPMRAERAEAAFAAREVVVDYLKQGSAMAAFRAVTPFTSIHIGGIDQFVRKFKDNPKSVSAAMIGLYTVPKLMLWWANKDATWYKEENDFIKSTCFITKIPWWTDAKPDDLIGRPADEVRKSPEGRDQVNNGWVVRLPLPFVQGIFFGGLPEAILNRVYQKDPNALRDFDKAIMGAVVPQLMPAAAITPFEIATNHNLASGHSLIPASQEKLLPAEQRGPYTTDTARLLGRYIGELPFIGKTQVASPIVLDQMIRNQFGNSTSMITSALDAGLKATGATKDFAEKPAKDFDQLPYVNELLRHYPSLNSKSIQDFEDRYREVDTVWNTINQLKKEGDINGVNRILRQYPNDLERLKGVHTMLVQGYGMIHKIQDNRVLTPEQKRIFIQRKAYDMIQAAELGNQALDQGKGAQ